MLYHNLAQAEEGGPFERAIPLLELEKPRHFVIAKDGDQPSLIERKACAQRHAGYSAHVKINELRRNIVRVNYVDTLLSKK